MCDAAAKPTTYLVPKVEWTYEGDRGITFQIERDGGYYLFHSVKAMPKVVEYKGELFARTGWNSDSGEVYYKARKAGELARPA